MGESVLSPAAPAESPLYSDAGLERRNGSLYFGGVALTAIADAVGTPAYLYNAGVVRRQFRALDHALAAVPHRVAYAVKANANLAVLRILRDLGAGADIVSGGELARALAAGFEPGASCSAGWGRRIRSSPPQSRPGSVTSTWSPRRSWRRWGGSSLGSAGR